jgi:hypothetical protein
MYRAPAGDAAILFVSISMPSVPGRMATAANKTASMATTSSVFISYSRSPIIYSMAYFRTVPYIIDQFAGDFQIGSIQGTIQLLSGW